MIRSLRSQGIRVCLATNQQALRAAYMRVTLNYGNHFDALFFSCELGCAKPTPDYFGAVVERLGERSEQLLFIDDHDANVNAARGAGLRAEAFVITEGVSALEAHLAAHGVLKP